jgi:hypothetical protein
MKHFLPLMLALAAAPAVADKTVAITPADLGEVTALDEVVVKGDRALSAARIAIVAAEDRFYDRWNALNADRRFDIKCRMETPRDHHSRIAHRVCEPAFVEELMLERARDALADSGNVMRASVDPAATVLQTELQKRTLEILRKDPELQRALLERARLAQHYEELRKEKFRDRWIRGR